MRKDVNAIIALKDEIIALAEEIKAAKKENIIDICKKRCPPINFRKGIYDKTSTYFSNLVNKIYSEPSRLLTRLDNKIIVILR